MAESKAQRDLRPQRMPCQDHRLSSQTSDQVQKGIVCPLRIEQPACQITRSRQLRNDQVVPAGKFQLVAERMQDTGSMQQNHRRILFVSIFLEFQHISSFPSDGA